MFYGIWKVFNERKESGRGLGARSIQLLALIILTLSIVILSLANVLKPDTTGTLLAALIGYILSGLGKEDKKPKGNKTAHANTTDNRPLP